MPNPTQLRRSPRKKVSTASVINENYRFGPNKALSNISVADGRSSIYSNGDTNSVVSTKKSLPDSSRNYTKQARENCDDKIELDEKGDTPSTRSRRLRKNLVEDQGSKLTSEISCGNSDENFKIKLRNAVYDALIDKSIDKENKVIIDISI